MQAPQVVAIGELLWDLFPDGPKLGGAPTNFAYHAAALGAAASMVTAVGNDDLGHEALRRLRDSGVNTSCITLCETRPTGSVEVRVDAKGTASYRFHENEAWDRLDWDAACGELADRCDAICFGTLGQRSEHSKETIQRMVDRTPSTSLRLLDLNLRPPYIDEPIIEQSLRLATALKLNEPELDRLAAQYRIDRPTAREKIEVIAERFELRWVALTRGARGAMLFTGSEISERAASEIQVVDTVGAGDAFAAAMVVGIQQGLRIDEINRWACEVAEWVCQCDGATPRLPTALRRGQDYPK